MRSSSSRKLEQKLERFEHLVARSLIGAAAHLPEFLKERIRREADGARPHPEVEMMLALLERQGLRGLRAESVALARARARRSARVHRGKLIPVASVRDLEFAGPGGRLRARLYAPSNRRAEAAPLLVFLHGGGFVIGDLDSHDAPCRSLCRDLDVFVLAVDYRLAPEHPFPAAVEDACAALRFARENAASWGADPARIGIGGDSAGGNLATVATLLAVRAGEPAPAMQLLIYPTVDSTVVRPSVGLFRTGFFLTHEDMLWFSSQYVGESDPADPRISPLLAPDLTGMPPALIVTAHFDPLRDEGEAYVEALRQAGNHVEHVRLPDQIHGFINFGSLSRAAQTSLSRIASGAHDLLWRPHRAPAQVRERALTTSL